MNYSDYFEELKSFLQTKYTTINWESDFSVLNKTQELAYMICKRINDPAPEIKHQKQDLEEVTEGWEMHL